MIEFDPFGLPKESGATDYADSPRLASMLVLFDHPNVPNLKLYREHTWMINNYTTSYKLKYVRHPFTVMKPSEPENDPKNFSRDQMIPLTAGLLKQGIKTPIPGWRAQNGDLLIHPSQRGHFKICNGEKPNNWNYEGIELDLEFNSFMLKCWHYGLRTNPPEQTQLISMCYTYGLFKTYKYSSQYWEKALEHYWDEWRETSKTVSSLIIQGIKNS